jgi:hypothetical protein
MASHSASFSGLFLLTDGLDSGEDGLPLGLAELGADTILWHEVSPL